MSDLKSLKPAGLRADQCRGEPGKLRPVIDRARCEGKRACVEVCPTDVFEVRRIDDADFARLSLLGRLESLVHRRQGAYTPRADACQACGLCVAACPEKAIRLVAAGRPPAGSLAGCSRSEAISFTSNC